MTDRQVQRVRGDRPARTRPRQRRLVRRAGGSARTPARVRRAQAAAERDGQRRPDHRPAAAEARAGGRDRASSSRRCRTCASAGASRARSTSTRCRTPRTSTSSRPGRHGLLERLRKVPELKDVNTDQQTAGSSCAWRSIATPPRGSACRVRGIDATLYDAFGQRQVATTYAAINQYRVVLEVTPEFRERRPPLQRLYVRSAPGTLVPLVGVRHATSRGRPPLSINHQGQFPAVTLSFNLAPGVSLGDAVDGGAGAPSGRSGCRPSVHAGFQGTAQAFQALARQRADADPRRARRRLHRARRALREPHPPDHHPLDAALGRRGRAARAAALRDASSASSRSSASSCSSAS